jgi:hypothetical protein
MQNKPDLFARPFRTFRRLDYERRLLVNPHLETLEPEGVDLETAYARTGMTIGYPAWNLLYYTLFCSPQPDPTVYGEPALPRGDLVVVETGTNFGVSTIVMAQALKDLGVTTKVRTVDLDESLVDRARRNVEEAGLTDFVEFNVGDSLAFLSALVEDVDEIDFVFLDDDHGTEHVVKELDIICPKITPGRGKIYFDNTTGRGVSGALDRLKKQHGGNLIHFPNCSLSPPGNAIWQPD